GRYRSVRRTSRCSAATLNHSHPCRRCCCRCCCRTRPRISAPRQPPPIRLGFQPLSSGASRHVDLIDAREGGVPPVATVVFTIPTQSGQEFGRTIGRIRLQMRMVIGLVAALTLPVTIAASCSDGNSAAGTAGSAASSAPTCPKEWAADWQAWADKVGMTVWCPTYLPSPIDGRIGPANEYNTARSPGRHWQLGYVWRDEDFSGLVHIVFEGMPDKLWPPRCGGMLCFAGPSGRSVVAGHDVRWYIHNMGSSSGHIA